jgi:orotidine-5'-phosphate decarboxylase
VHFGDRLAEVVRGRGNPVCLGIDPRPEDLPEGFLERFDADRKGVASALGVFSRELIEIAAEKVPVVKFQSAFFEAYGPEGVAALADAMSAATAAGLIVIFDGKRNDIGSTAEGYARAYLGKVPVVDRFESCWSADAITVNPYLGSDGIQPFIKVGAREGKGIFCLVRTSNASAREFQDLKADGKPLYRHVADRLAGWAAPHVGGSGYGIVGAVVGATYPAEMTELRAALPGIWFLVPGYGTQGGSASDVAPSFATDGLGAIVNSSRGLAFAHQKPAARDKHGADWKASVVDAIDEMIADLAAHTPSAQLKS